MCWNCKSGVKFSLREGLGYLPSGRPPRNLVKLPLLVSNDHECKEGLGCLPGIDTLPDLSLEQQAVETGLIIIELLLMAVQVYRPVNRWW